MRQSTTSGRGGSRANPKAAQSPAYAPLLERIRQHLPALVAELARDVALPHEDAAAVEAEVGPVVAWMLDALAEAELLRPERLAVLHAEGQRAATAGESLQRLLDRYLSTGWVVWAAAMDEAVGDPAVPALGTALLKAGDAAAAAIAGGHGEAERALALRAAGARREFVDELLDLPQGDAEAAARIRRRAVDFGLDPAASYRVIVAALGRDHADGSADLEAIGAALAPVERLLPRRAGAALPERPAAEPLVASRRGRVVVLLVEETPSRIANQALEEVFGRIGPHGWLAVAAPPVMGLTRLSEAYGTAIEALAVAARLGRSGLIDADEVLLERALLADETLLAAAVARELGPILSTSRNARALYETLGVYVESAENLRATARQLGIAPRTVAYRMARIEALLGGPLRGPRLVRVAAALLAARLLPPQVLETLPVAVVAAGAPSRPGVRPNTPRPEPATAPADRPRRVPRGRSRTRRNRGTAT